MIQSRSFVRSVIVDLRGPDGAATLLPVAGLPVLLRNLLLLQRHAFGPALILCDPSTQASLQAITRDPRLTLAISLSPTDEHAVAWLGDSADAVVLFWPAGLSFGRFVPAMIDQDVPANSARALVGTDGDVGLVLTSAATLAAAPGGSIAGRLAWLAANDRVIPQPSDREAFRIRGLEDARRAEAALLRSLRKNADGVVAKYDRHISLGISRRLMTLHITPNQVTIVAALIGALCGWAVAQGGYFWMLAGALGFQLNSIADGIDGEIARAKLLESHFGQWLDTIADDFSNLAFVVGAGLGCYRTYGWSGYLVLGVLAGVGQVITSVIEYHYIITVARSGDLNDFKLPWERHPPSRRPKGPGARIGYLAKVDWLFRRDAFVAFSTLLALIGQLRVMTWAFAIGANLIWTSVLGYRALRGPLAAEEIEPV